MAPQISTFARKMAHKQGWVSETVRQEFHMARYTMQSVLDLVLSFSFKVLSNYTSHRRDSLRQELCAHRLGKAKRTPHPMTAFGSGGKPVLTPVTAMEHCHVYRLGGEPIR